MALLAATSRSATWSPWMLTTRAERNLPSPQWRYWTCWPVCNCARTWTMRRGSANSCAMTQLSWYNSALVAIGRSSISLMRMGPFCPPQQGLGSGRQRHVLRAGVGVPLRSDCPWQQLVDAVARVLGNAIQDVAQVALRVDPVEPGRAQQRVHHRRGAAARV